ncbi:hypothetical protein GCM10018792_62320 [Streptomyces rubradiris]|nr:hypothetical protein GCM10018792_62320 [Streptomyces rubradiris]
MLDALTAGRTTAPMPGASGGQATELVPIASLVTSDSPRIAGEDAEHVEALAETRSPLPPIVVHRPTMRIVDGVHRLRAAVLRGEDMIEVRYVEGSAEDAFVLAVRLNAEHGMPLSRRDRLSAAERIIDSHAHWSDRRIAEVTGLAPATVSSLRRRSTAQDGQVHARTGRDGRSRPVNSAAGRRRAGQVIAERPNASLREIAQEAGIALATARDVRLRIREGKDPVPPKVREAARELSPSESRVVPGRPAGQDAGRVAVQDTGRVVRSRSEPALISGAGRLGNLRQDPSLRFSEAGRALLQLLAANALDDEKWRWLMGAVPEHRYADIARAARYCGERWLSFAEGLEHGGAARPGRAV